MEEKFNSQCVYKEWQKWVTDDVTIVPEQNRTFIHGWICIWSAYSNYIFIFFLYWTIYTWIDTSANYATTKRNVIEGQ
jgi:hypothetical protein